MMNILLLGFLTLCPMLSFADVVITPLKDDSIETISSFNGVEELSGLKAHSKNKLNLAIPKQKQKADYLQERLSKPLYISSDSEKFDLF